MNQRILVSMIEPIQTGYEFKRSDWPLHVTIVPWFKVKDQSWFTSGLVTATGKQNPIRLEVGRKELFGAKRNVPVSVIVPHQELSDLHKELLRLVNEWGELQSDRFVGSKYRPHVTHQKGKSLVSGNELVLNNVCIVELIDESTCRVVAKHEL